MGKLVKYRAHEKLRPAKRQLGSNRRQSQSAETLSGLRNLQNVDEPISRCLYASIDRSRVSVIGVGVSNTSQGR